MRTLSLALRCAASLCAAAALLAWPVSAQEQGRLRIHIALPSADGTLLPVSRHALLISLNPTQAAPRRVLTGPDGTIIVSLRPGNYTVESDEPLSFLGRGYSWTETLDVPAGVETPLELNAGNAELGAASASGPDAGRVTADPTLVERRYKDGVVAVWTPSRRASGFLVDASGLLVTSRRVVAGAERVDVELPGGAKVAGRVLVADQSRDAAVVWVDPSVVTGRPFVSLACGAGAPVLAPDQQLATLGVPVHEGVTLMTGDVLRVDPHAVTADLALPPGAEGGPVFTLDGTPVGLTSPDEERESRRREALVVPVADACEMLAKAKPLQAGATPPSPAPLPIEPARAYPEAALRSTLNARPAATSPERVSAAEFDVAFITPPMVFASRQTDRRTTSADTRGSSIDEGRLPPWSDFGAWTPYVDDHPAVVLVRVSPKLTEGFWARVGRGAAMTQGMNLPAIKHFEGMLSRLRVFCGETEVAPIHAFTLDMAVERSDSGVREGLYAFAPEALAPSCGSVRLMLYSEKNPQKPDTKAVDPAILARLAQDFDAYRQQP